MDQDLGWWVRIALDDWQARTGPRHRRIAEALAEAIERGLTDPGAKLPAERPLADALRVGRGTVVRGYETLAEAGLVERRQGAGTFVRPRPGWTHPPTPVAAPVRRRLVADADVLDLSLSVPAGTGHLPPVDGSFAFSRSDDHGLPPNGLPELRAALADHLTVHLGLPTTPDQLIVTAGARHALALVFAALVSPGRAVLTGCPGPPGLGAAVTAAGGRPIGVGVDALGLDVAAVDRAAARLHAPVILTASAAHDPTGAPSAELRRRSLLAVRRSRNAVLVEDLTQAGLDLGPVRARPVPPAAAADDAVITIGSLSKMFWAGLRVGWLRAPGSLRGYLAQTSGVGAPAASVPTQVLATRLLDAADAPWQDGLRRALTERRDLLLELLARQLPAWRVEPPRAGLSLWADLPVADSTTFVHLAARYGVLVVPGTAACVDGRHRRGVRMSFAESPATLESAVDRLTAAWEEHTRRLAASR
ncbi:PLP-dependent aminotransferase family protein [Embleya scabrispora]|uniref:aminotransferase-like domain-containing protein n=1 Tax=Embleya scabrispora TaxID=159449 RepID=UPI0003767DD3|nr:PLP-dependent aminotransferase family protein [Embleya scabrispora]MYS85595.1 aminotransferase class I/II-fold pyridoxal phosphate-dependent enzyme [Streptomyces sp. SID5474]